MIESTGNYNYGPDDYKDRFNSFQDQPAQLFPLAEAETYVSIPLSEFARYIKREPIADRMAQLIAEEWLEAERRGYHSIGPTESEICLRFYDPELYAITKSRVNEIRAEREKEQKADVKGDEK